MLSGNGGGGLIVAGTLVRLLAGVGRFSVKHETGFPA